MLGMVKEHIQALLAEIEGAGQSKRELMVEGAQDPRAVGSQGTEVLNFCANNYLGLANHPDIVAAARTDLDRWGYGLSSVRFICGTQPIHLQLEKRLSEFLGTEDTILYSSCFDANAGLFEVLLGEEDAVISDELNHASIIDGIRLCKAQRFRYRNNDMRHLEAKLHQSRECRFRLVVTDGVFSMDGVVSDLATVCDLADRYHAMVMVDDSHAVGFMGEWGRGTHEHCGVLNRVDIITGTLGKALGGVSGGYTSSRQEIVGLLRQRSRPYLFSNSLAPSIVCASIKALEMVSSSTTLRDRLMSNTAYFRRGLIAAGFAISPGQHPIVPIMLGEARRAQEMAERMLLLGVYVVGFAHPVVPKGKARIPAQVSAAHSKQDLDLAVAAFAGVKQEMGL